MVLIQTAWQAAPVTTMYFASVDEREMMGYFFDAHEMAPDPK